MGVKHANTPPKGEAGSDHRKEQGWRCVWKGEEGRRKEQACPSPHPVVTLPNQEIPHSQHRKPTLGRGAHAALPLSIYLISPNGLRSPGQLPYDF